MPLKAATAKAVLQVEPVYVVNFAPLETWLSWTWVDNEYLVQPTIAPELVASDAKHRRSSSHSHLYPPLRIDLKLD